MARPINEENREKILDSAQALFSRHSFKKTTVEDIARETGIAKGSIYLHFKNKQEILQELVLRRVKKNIAILITQTQTFTDPIEKLKYVIEVRPLKAYEFMKEHHHINSLSIECIGAPSEEMLKKSTQYVAQYVSLIEEVLTEATTCNKLFIKDIKATAYNIHFMGLAFLPPYRFPITKAALKKQIENYTSMIILSLSKG